MANNMGMFKNKKGIEYKDTPKPEMTYGSEPGSEEDKEIEYLKTKRTSIGLNLYISYKLDVLKDALGEKAKLNLIERLIDEKIATLDEDEKMLCESRIKNFIKQGKNK